MPPKELAIKQSDTKTVNMKSYNNTLFEKKSDFGKKAFILRAQKFPDLRFACPNCGALDVLIHWKYFDTLKGQCLECKIEWNQEGNQ